jgi:hypothetical protein
MRCPGNVMYVEEILNKYRILVGEPEEKRPVG